MSTALLSVSDKRGLLELARNLNELGWDTLASGGTADTLRQAGLQVTDVAEYTGSPEVLGGRVKTLHPAVHGGILSRSTDADFADLERISARQIDLVAVNLYPFQQTVLRADVTLEEAVDNIDIGGVALIRAAAKNFTRVVVLTDPVDYNPLVRELIENGVISQETRYYLARKAFAHTSTYDAVIADYLGGRGAAPEEELNLHLYPVSKLRYGENPHQEATLYAQNPDAGPLGGLILQGKALSYNNLLDLDAAWRAVVSFQSPTISIVKHLSPCGIASAENLHQAFGLALASDPVSAFGGVVAANRLFDEAAAASLGDLFVECIAAPGFSRRALEILSERKNLRLVSMPDIKIEPSFELRSVNQGFLRQTVDLGDPLSAEWRVVTSRQPVQDEWLALHFAWKACQHVKSNAIVIAQGEATVGIGGGQPNRVDCVRIATRRAGERARGAVMASDAFFPFPDSIDEAAKAGITAIISPGGSVRDAEAIAVAEVSHIAMVFTGVRHFRH
jgi:phosphoribosylaminoimidazolecarboxamide formyltransferase/IMP cyclohydrolase